MSVPLDVIKTIDLLFVQIKKMLDAVAPCNCVVGVVQTAVLQNLDIKNAYCSVFSIKLLSSVVLKPHILILAAYKPDTHQR